MGPRSCKCLQPRDRVFEVEPPMEEILRTRGHDEVARRPCRRDGLPNALNRMFEGVDRLLLAAAGILDRRAGETRPDGRFHQAPASPWPAVESVFQAGADRDVAVGALGEEALR